jgi:hypothetical protein
MEHSPKHWTNVCGAPTVPPALQNVNMHKWQSAYPRVASAALSHAQTVRVRMQQLRTAPQLLSALEQPLVKRLSRTQYDINRLITHASPSAAWNAELERLLRRAHDCVRALEQLQGMTPAPSDSAEDEITPPAATVSLESDAEDHAVSTRRFTHNRRSARRARKAARIARWRAAIDIVTGNNRLRS